MTEEVRLDLTDLKIKNTPNENPIKDQSIPTGTNVIAKPYFFAEQMKLAQHSFDDDDLKGETSRDLVSNEDRAK